MKPLCGGHDGHQCGWSCQEPLESFATGAAMTQSCGTVTGPGVAEAGTLVKSNCKNASEKWI